MMSAGAPRAIVAICRDALRLAGALVDVGTLECLPGRLGERSEQDAERVLDLAAALLAEARRRGVTVTGLALAGPPGDEFLGTISARFGLPATTDAFMPAAMRGEQLWGGAQGRSSAVLFDTDRLTAGMVLNGRILRGAHGSAGNLAHTSVDRTGRVECRCGKVGCLTAMLATGPDGPDPLLPRSFPPMPSRRHGWLALAAIHLINIVNPAALILGGEIVAGDADFAWLVDAVERGSLAPARAGLERIARARPDNVLIGAAAHFMATTNHSSPNP